MPVCINLKTICGQSRKRPRIYRDMNMTHEGFTLAACAEMLWRDKPIEWRASRLKELGFGVGLWNWPDHDLARLEATGATFTIMNGYLRGRLTDDAGAAELLETARQTARDRQAPRRSTPQSARDRSRRWRSACQPVEVVTGAMWLKARDTLCRIVDLAEEETVTFTLENLNLPVDHPGCHSAAQRTPWLSFQR